MGFIAGIIPMIIKPEVLYSMVDFYFIIRDVNSIPLVQVLNTGSPFYKIIFLVKTNILYECIMGLFLPGILNIALLVLLIKYLSLGMFVALVLFSDFSLVVPLMLLIAIFEAVGFSIASFAGDDIGRAWLRSRGFSSRVHSLKKSFKKSIRVLLSAMIILAISSLIELVLSYLLLI